MSVFPSRRRPTYLFWYVVAGVQIAWSEWRAERTSRKNDPKPTEMRKEES